MATALCCAKKHSSNKYSNEAGYEVYTISEDQLRLKQKMKDRKEGVHVEYVTSRLIVLSCTAETSERKFVESLAVAAQQIQTAHSKHFKVWNVSQRRHDISASLEATPFGWPSETAPPLEKLCTICKNLDQWMLEHPLNVAVVFCKGGLERSAVVINAFMRYNAISATDDSVEDRFSMQRFSERFLGPDGSPSYKRYLTYFSSLLSGRITVNSEPLYLHHVVLTHFNTINVFLKIYERLLPVYQSRTVSLKETTKFDMEGSLKLRGDVFFKCIIAASSPGSPSRCLFTCQLNTCALELQPINAEGYSVVKLHKEELDLIFNDKKVDNRVTVELIVSHTKGPTTIAAAAVQSVTNLLPRNNSYETFEVAQDEETNRSKLEVEYSEIKKSSSSASKKHNNNQEEMPVGPPVPPKPATPISMMNGSANGAAEYQGDMPERRGILPASLREKINQKKELEGRATPLIEPDLVGRDRYDKASRCFSYVPAKSMQEAFERPRRTSFSRAIEKRENSVENVSQEEVARTQIPPSYPQEPILTPAKWDDQVEDAKQAALLEELARAPSAMQQNYWDQEDQDHVQVVDQAQRAVVTPTSTLQRRGRAPQRAGSYRTLNDDAYCSDMDELCDPEYYLNFNTQAPAPPPRQQHAGARSVQLPRKKMNFDAVTDPLDDILESTKKLSSAYSVGDVRQPQLQNNDFNFQNLSHTLNSSNQSQNQNQHPDVRQHYRNRNCQSVTTPRNHHFSTGNQSQNQENDADNWLSGKLKKVRSKRDIDPDLVRRRTQEKMLLEELKDSRAANEDQNGHVNGHYKLQNENQNQNIDPLAEFRREEERLRNTRSPYGDERWRGRMRGKPPTPPPRESSNSPVNRATPSLEQTRNRHNQSVPLPMHHRQFDEDFDVNSLLNFSHDPPSTLDRGRSLSRGARIQDAYYASQQDLLPNRFYSGQERVAAAIYRAETPHREMYASGTINRAETPGRYFPENSVLLERAATPSFPVSRATPLPFHPLLYNNGEREQNTRGGGHNGYNTMNNRSASPRHFGGSSTLSRRSSTNSVDTATTSSTTVVIHLRNSRSTQDTTASTTAQLQQNTRRYCDVSLASSEESSDLSDVEEKEDLIRRNHTTATSSSKETMDDDEEEFDDVVMEEEVEQEKFEKVPRQALIVGNGGVGGPGGGGILKKSSCGKDTSEIIHHHPLFVKDTSKYWYKPTITREQAIGMLRDKPPGTFVVRDSNSFPGAFGLALKVATPPPGVNPGDGTELVRHFLIEPSPKGVKLKGCNNEPVFGSLSALVYQHSITALALPTKLVLPDFDPAATPEHLSATQALLEQGAACNVVYVGSVDVESLTGNECVKRSIATCSQRAINGETRAVSVHFKVSSQGVTLTDNTRKVFFRRHFNVQSVIFAGMDPIDRQFDNTRALGYHDGCTPTARLFAFVARIPSSTENACHVFAELEPGQPATAVVNFINKVMLAQKNRP